MSHRLSDLGIGCIIAGLVCAGFTGCATGSKKALSKTERARLYVDAAKGSLTDGDAIGALQTLARAEVEDSNLPDLHHTKAIAYFLKRDLENAILAVRKATELKPDYADANNTLGKLLLDTGRTKEAEKYLLKAANDPLYREAYKARTSLGMLYYRSNDPTNALKQLDLAIQEMPSVACVAYYYRGHIHLRNGKFKEATRDYDRASNKVCSSFADAHFALGIAYERNQQYDLARKKFLDIRQSFPDTKVAEQALERLRYIP